MGEEEKKVEEVKKDDPPKDEKPSGGEEKKEEKKGEEESKEAKAEPPPPPPPSEIVLRVFMHCEGCARKVRKCLKGFQGVEDVLTDCKTHKVVVKGEKADPLKVLERIQKKSHRQVELLSPIPKPPAPADEPKKPEEKEAVKPQEKKEEPQVITVVLKVHMHCEACAQEIKKRIQRMKGVENAEPDLKNSQVTVKGVFEETKLVEYVSKRTGKRAVIVKVEPEKKAEEESKGKEDEKEEKKTDEKEAKKVEEGVKKEEKKEEATPAAAAAAAPAPANNEEVPAPAPTKEEAAVQNDADPKLDVKKNEFYYYHHPQNQHQLYNPQRFAHEMHAYPPPPQIFSDENPNACSVM